MNGFILSTVLAFASVSHAGFMPYQTREEAFKAVPVCAGAVTMDATRVARVGDLGQIAITGLGQTEAFDLPMTRDAVDLKIQGQTLYVLTTGTIQEWSMTERKMISEMPTINTDIRLQHGEEATGMDWHGTSLVISHGGMGYSIYDTVNHKITDHVLVLRDQFPMESRLTSVVVVGDQAIFSVDNWTLSMPDQKGAFIGFLVMDLNTGKEIHRSPGPDVGNEMMVLAGDQLIVGYGMIPLHAFKLSDVLNGKRAMIQKIVMTYPVHGHPIGRAFYADNKLMTCFRQSGTEGQPSHTMPMVIEGSQFKR